MKDKSKLRLKLAGKRSVLPESKVREYSDKIVKNLINYISWKEINNINTYQAIKKNNEININDLLDFIKQNHPGIQIDITENKASAPQNTPEGRNYDLILVPLLGFDRTANRLGYGGGYYDKFLSKNDCKQIVGLAYSFQEVESLPLEAHDQKLDLIITEKEIIEP